MNNSRDKQQEVLHSDFDINTHKETFINYLEVVISPDGKVEYAVPSHQEKLIQVCCTKLGWTRDELQHNVPKEYLWDFQEWLCKTSGYIMVWNDMIYKSKSVPLTELQIKSLNELIKSGLYHGSIN